MVKWNTLLFYNTHRVQAAVRQDLVPLSFSGLARGSYHCRCWDCGQLEGLSWQYFGTRIKSSKGRKAVFVDTMLRQPLLCRHSLLLDY